ncbi:MAG TPA: VPLPA-CTERM sorting domain-containing protein [Lamprocystis sp. (in: g-proteobacteria)]|nr:VPLPA-CTERM sorting domain-containing protein [Lamprocystis sp. (in: g-proteobacteria)]
MVFTNPTSITIGPNIGAASPYPSSILVSGAGNSLTSLTLDFFDLSHTYPSDIYAVVQGPTGTAVVLMADAGDSYNVINVNLTFDDAAAGLLPDINQIVSGTYRVSQYGSANTLPTPAPSPAFGTNLSAFAGLDPNGTWKLWLYDDTGGDGGSLAGGWGLNLNAASVPVPTSALLLLTGLGALAGVRRVRRVRRG